MARPITKKEGEARTVLVPCKLAPNTIAAIDQLVKIGAYKSRSELLSEGVALVLAIGRNKPAMRPGFDGIAEEGLQRARMALKGSATSNRVKRPPKAEREPIQPHTLRMIHDLEGKAYLAIDGQKAPLKWPLLSEAFDFAQDSVYHNAMPGYELLPAEAYWDGLPVNMVEVREKAEHRAKRLEDMSLEMNIPVGKPSISIPVANKKSKRHAKK